MILGFFKTNQPAVAFAIPVIVLVLWLPAFFHPVLAPMQDGMPLYKWIYAHVEKCPSFVTTLLCILIVSFQSIYIHRIVVKHEVLYKNNYMPSLMFAVLASCLPEFQQFTPVLVVNLLMLAVINKTFGMFKEESPVSNIFDSCFIISVASLVYLPAAFFFLLFLIALLVVRPFHWREWVIAFIGFLLPYFFLTVYLLWVDRLKQFYSWLFGRRFNYTLFYDIHFNRPLILLIILFGGLLIVSLFRLRDNFYKNAIKTRIVQQVIVVYLIVAVLSAVFQSTIQIQQFELLAFPMAILIGYFYLSGKRRLWMYDILFLTMIVLVGINIFRT
jgi:hypothetical protein